MSIAWLNWNELPPAECRGGAVAVGNFDGVHLGHASLVRTLRENARPAVVISFDPHPLLLLAPDRFQPLLTTPEDRAGYLLECGVDRVILLRTTPELLVLSAEEYFGRILCEGFRARAVVEGFNFRFGRDRGGDTALLARLCKSAQIGFTLVPPMELDGVPVSSSRVRSAIATGDVMEAARLMGRPYRLSGIVVGGAGRGRALGFPTANLEQVSTLIPGDGVYAVRVQLYDRVWAGAANIGPNPTFGEQERKLEVHLIDAEIDLYGSALNVSFLRRLRGTRKFDGKEDLVHQLRLDVDQARAVFQESLAT